MGWIKTMRPAISIMAATLTIAGYKAAYHAIPTHAYLVSSAIFVVFLATMVWNDYQDREQDAKKGKTWAKEHSHKLMALSMLSWLVAALAAQLFIVANFRITLLLFAEIAIGFIYSEIRRVPLLPILLVSFASAIAVLFPWAEGTSPSWRLFWAVTLVIFAREILKDLDDINNDKDYKWTLPLAIGAYPAKFVAGICLVETTNLIISRDWLVFGTIMLLWSAVRLTIDQECKKTKLLVDFGLILILISILTRR